MQHSLRLDFFFEQGVRTVRGEWVKQYYLEKKERWIPTIFQLFSWLWKLKNNFAHKTFIIKEAK